MRDFSDMAMQLDAHRAEFPRDRGDRLPTEFVWRDPASIPQRPWVYGRHLIRKQVSVTVAPGGVGKSSLTICEALAMASGRELLGDWTAKGLKVWLYNLEDPRDEMDRRIIAAMQHHHVSPEEIAGRLYVDTGRERALSTAIQTREGVQIIKPELDALANEIQAREIDVLVIDPFVSSHQASENDNGAIDLVAKEWARLSGETRDLLLTVDEWLSCETADVPPRQGQVVVGIDLGGSASMTAAAFYWPETGRLAAMIAEEASEKFGMAVKLDVMRPLQAFDAGGRARALGAVVQTLALAKEAGVDPSEALRLVDWENGV